MEKKPKGKVFVKVLFMMFAVCLICLVGFFAYFLVITKDVKLDSEALAISSEDISILMSDGTDIMKDSLLSEYTRFEDLPKNLINGFVATEDKRFYSHKGVDYLRIGSALLKNIKNGGFKEGASTITQQVVKNTQLTSEKTIDRKLKEIKLAKSLEKKYSKNEIMEMYVNNIYFGNGCYGITKASKFYFDKLPKDLSLNECALLVASVNAPSVYDIINKPSSANKRKNLVLKNMLKNNFITNEEYEKNANLQVVACKNASTLSFMPTKLILSEACEKLKIDENILKSMHVKIYTNFDFDLQKEINNSVLPYSSSYSCNTLVIDNKTSSIISCALKGGNLLNTKRQPGSTIKPILVYALPLENGVLCLDSFIKDEEVNFNGYSPTNADKQYHGYVSVKYALEKSLNIPAVKTLSNTGINNAKNFAKKLGIKFSENDQNLALALGGFTDGITIDSLADAYSCLACEGEYAKSGFIEKIESASGNLLYKKDNNKTQVMSKATAYLLTDALIGVSKEGTAKRLASLPFSVASKTGTVGKNNGLNTDAINVSYTPSYTIVSWLFDKDMPKSVNGASYPTEMNKKILAYLYKDKPGEEFVKPSDVVTKDVDIRGFSDGKLMLASEITPQRYKKPCLFNEKFLPEVTTYDEPSDVVLSVEMEENTKPIIKFKTENGNSYKVFRKDIASGEEQNIITTEGNNTEYNFEDKTAKSEVLYEYYLVAENKNSLKEKMSNTIKLLSY